MLPVLTLLPAASSLVMLAALSAADLQRLAGYEAAWADAGSERTLSEQARVDFAGRGVEIADHFLTHTGSPPRNGAYFFVLRAVGGADTALTLIRALVDPPARESGILDRHYGEIASAIEAVLSDGAARADPRVVLALDEAVASARGKPHGSGAHEALEAVRLIGMSGSEDAARVLSRLSADPDAAIRAAAAQALGQLAAVAGTPGPDQPSPTRRLLALLAADPSPRARREAAEALGSIAESEEADEGLRAALGTEPDPRVIDAVVLALLRRGAMVTDPARCRDLVGRAWEAPVAQLLFECWRRQGPARGELLEAALEGPPTQRAVALRALTASATPPSRSLVAGPAFSTVQLEPALRARLLEGTVWVLSQGDAISLSTRDAGEQALWHLSGGRMDQAMDYADRVTPSSARYGASAALARADLDAYDAARRRQHTTPAAVAAIGFLLLAGWLGRPALLLALSSGGWALSIALASGVRALPPPQLQWITIAALAFLSAGAVAAGAAVLPWRALGMSTGRVRITLTSMIAGLMGGTFGVLTRSARLFPGDQAGWELILDPLDAAGLAAVVAAVLAAIDVAMPRRARIGANQ